jgi:uncharacterized protein
VKFKEKKMAVIVKYIVVRNGDEKMTFATKKEADEYDKMLDIADNVLEFLANSKLGVEESQLQDMSLYLAQNRDTFVTILKGSRPKKKTPTPSDTKTQADSPSKLQANKKSKSKGNPGQETSE